MPEEVKKAEVAAPAETAKKTKKKKLRPTNCAFSNKRIRRKDWYYRDGKYFANKKNYKLWVAQELEKKAKVQEAEKAAAQAKEAAAEAPPAETA